MVACVCEKVCETRLDGITPRSITHARSLANTWVCFSSPQDAESKGIKCSLTAVAAASFLLLYLCNHRITGHLGPRHGSLVGDVHGLFGLIYIANVVERLNLKLISFHIISNHIKSYHICFLERPAPCNSHQSLTHKQGAIGVLAGVLRRSSAVIGVAIHLCITPYMYHLSCSSLESIQRRCRWV